jgi:membrane fusion protein, multidrug efflux system
MNFRKIFFIPVVALLLVFAGCSSEKKEEAKSMDQIQAADGIPISVEPVAFSAFKNQLSFFTKLTGIKQSTRGALIGGKIEKINAKVGDRVKKGDVIVEFPQNEPSIAIEQAKSAYEDSKKNLDRLKKLLDAGETAQANYDAMETKYQVDKRNYETQKQLIFVDTQFDGVITEIMVKEGDNVKSETGLFTVAQVNVMRAKVWASGTEIETIRKGMTAVIEENGKTFYGKVTEVSMSVDPSRQSFYAEVEFQNPAGALKAGVVIEVKINVYENGKTIVVPRNLVKKDEKGMYVFVENNLTAQKKYIVIAKENGIKYEVKSGLNAGDKLIVKGSGQLADGSKVKPVQ